MATDKDFKNKYDTICQNLSERKLKPAFDLLEAFINSAGLVAYLDEWRNLEQTYKYMLQYTVEGIYDPERQKVYQKLIVDTYSLTDKLFDDVYCKQSPALVYEKKRGLAANAVQLDNMLQELEDFYLNNELLSLVDETGIEKSSPKIDAGIHQQKIVSLFYYFWLKNTLNAKEISFLKDFSQSELIQNQYKALLVISLFLSLMYYFDEAKFMLLFDLYEMEDAEMNQRALIGLLINLFKYDSRLASYPAITGRLKILAEDNSFKQDLERVIVQLIRSKETEKIQKKLTDEIIPEMIKISPNLNDKINLDSLMDDSLGEDKNPEWEKIFDGAPGLMDKMEEFSELQQEGADVFMASFAMLKMFPFFSEFSNWFMPFFAENPDVAMVIDKEDSINSRFIEAINSAPILCNSDKYSFCFSISNLPAENREFMAEGMNAEMSQFNEIQKDEALTEPGKMAGYVSNQFVHDLYRFYKLHPRKSDFEDIFSWRFDFHNKTIIGDILKEDDKMLRNIAEYYFSKDYFDDAAEIFNYLLTVEQSGELYQKLGFCHQKSGDFKKALKAYKNADLYDLNKKWNLNKIAVCYRNLKQPENALEYYRQVETLDEENLNVQLNIGHCLLELEQFDEALKTYFKVEYLAPGNKKVRKPIAWCSFVTGKIEQAENYYAKLLADKPNEHDLMNMGHVKWAQGLRKEALDYYKKAIKQTELTADGFFSVFEEDLPYLITQGVNKDDVPIMLDQLRYYVQNK